MSKKFDKRKKVVYDLICDDLYTPMKFKELAMLLRVAKEDRDELRQILEALEHEGKIYLSKRGKYCKGHAKRLTGVFRASLKGFGFVVLDEGDSEDVFIGADDTCGAFDGDHVEIVLTKEPEGRSREGKIVKILERGLSKVVGLYRMKPGKKFGFVIPDNQRLDQDIFVPIEKSRGAVDGHKVVVELTSYGENGKKPEGKIVEIIGHLNDPGTDIMSIVKGYDLPVEFPDKVLRQAERVAKPVSEADMNGRKDLRDWQMVTIDGEDAKDLDDAVSLTMEKGMYRLGVHIADVTNYVQENSALDWEAKERGTSVYLVDRVIPMLPHTLSNGICSLNAGEDRLALSCLMTIDETGTVVDYKIAETVICVDKRLSYKGVRKILEDHDVQEIEACEALVPMLEQMQKLSEIVRRKRRNRGAVDFDFQECEIKLDKSGHPVDILPHERNVATKLIEDFMLLANETVAQHFFWLEVPFVYRTHDKPDPEKIQKLTTFLNNFGYSLKGTRDEIHPKELQKLLTRIEGTKEEDMLSRLILRSMKRAQYQDVCTGHFGLACKYYCHFTSPIRRYPDLQIHRIIKEYLRGRLKEERILHYKDILPQVCKHASEMERRADEAERETDKLKKAEYMTAHMDEEYDGVISGIMAYGIYVELENTVEGLIRAADIPGDYYVYDEAACEMVGRHTGNSYRLGDRIHVYVKDVDLQKKTIDFGLHKE